LYLPIIISVVALTISLSALTVAILNYRRKSSARVRGRFGISRSIYGEDDYVSSVTLENMKDRPITILSIQLRVGYNYYIEIEDFKATPLIIKAFETWHAEYEPIDFYAVNTRKIDLNHLFSGKRPARLILSTTDGRLKVKEFKKYWDPVHDYLLKNPLTIPVHPVRIYYKGKVFGGKTKYIIEVTGVRAEPMLVPVHESDAGIEKLVGIVLSAESLTSATALDSFLVSKKAAHPSLADATFRVVDMADVRRNDRMYDGKERIVAPGIGFIVYHVLSPLKVAYDRFTARRTDTAKKPLPSETDDDSSRGL